MNAVIDEPDSEKAAEYLRLALPLMSRHHIPATPRNYTIWYAYVSGENPALHDEIDRLVSTGQRFTPSINAHLYRRFVSETDLDELEQTRCGLGDLIQEISSSLRSAGGDTAAFVNTLDRFAKIADESDDLNGIRQHLRELIKETQSICAMNKTMEARFIAKLDEIESLHKQLLAERKRTLSDPLTGLFNRNTLFDHIEDAIGNADEDAPPSLIMFDIDHFKRVNDTHGHLVGDRVIRFVARVIEDNIKGQDTAARFGGEEFVALLPATPRVGAKTVADTIRDVIEHAQLVRVDNKEPIGGVTISAGVATYRPGETITEFLNRADQAMYRSKKAGRNQVSVD